MKASVFYIFYVINWIITLLPLRILFIFSDFFFLLLYYFPGYRKNIVMTNLRNSFPEKSDEELKSIARKFYRHLADMPVEVLKITHLSRRQLKKRCRIENIELIQKLYSEGRDIAAVMGHYNNWEYLTVIALLTKYRCIAIYRPLKNKYFDRFLLKLRSKYNMVLSPMSQVVRDIIACKNRGEKIIVSFLTDQTPACGDINYWTRFLNQDTPVYLGAGKIASKYDMAVVFFNIRKVKRGYYSVNLELLFDHTSGVPAEQITETHVKRLEKIIMEKPEFWLWSHRRWKYKRTISDGQNSSSHS